VRVWVCVGVWVCVRACVCVCVHVGVCACVHLVEEHVSVAEDCGLCVWVGVCGRWVLAPVRWENESEGKKRLRDGKREMKAR
jgi:hypothetical protein